MFEIAAPILIWAIYVAGNILLAMQNDKVRRDRIAKGIKKQIEHFWYGLGYVIACGIPFIWYHSFYQFFALLLLHASVFPTAFNTYSEIYIFNLSKTTTAITDRLYLKIGLKTIEFPVVLFLLSSIALLIIQIRQA